MSASAARKTDLYDLLGVPRNASADDIRKAYRKCALKWHPDRNIDNIDYATTQFKLIQQAYDTLIDDNERAFYDSHREAILAGRDPLSAAKEDGGDGDELLQYFTAAAYNDFSDNADGFFAVYSRVFADIESSERFAEEADDELDISDRRPPLGARATPAAAVREFYSYWSAFVSHRSFAHHDKWKLSEAPNRQVRRLMETENKKLRTRAKKDYAELVRDLVAYIRKRDPRIAEMERSEKQSAAAADAVRREKLRVDDSIHKQAKAAHSELESQRWAEQDRARKEAYGDLIDDDKDDDDDDDTTKVYECLVCKKSFKSEKQYENHEQSRKHKDNLSKYQQQHPPQEQERNAKAATADGVTFECASCQLVFGQSKKLAAHEKTTQHRAAVVAMREELQRQEKEMIKAAKDLTLNSEHNEHNNDDDNDEQGEEQDVDQDEGDDENEDEDEDEDEDDDDTVDDEDGDHEFGRSRSDDSDSDTPRVPKIHKAKKTMNGAVPTATIKRKGPRMFVDSDDEDDEDDDEDEGEEEVEDGEDAANDDDVVGPRIIPDVARTANIVDGAGEEDDDDDENLAPMESSLSGVPTTATPPTTAAQRRALRKQKRQAKAANKQSSSTAATPASATNAETDSSNRCKVCKSKFSSRTKLFAHLKSTGHAKPI